MPAAAITYIPRRSTQEMMDHWYGVLGFGTPPTVQGGSIEITASHDVHQGQFVSRLPENWTKTKPEPEYKPTPANGNTIQDTLEAV